MVKETGSLSSFGTSFLSINGTKRGTPMFRGKQRLSHYTCCHLKVILGSILGFSVQLQQLLNSLGVSSSWLCGETRQSKEKL
jgi:hypothetical protein